MPVLSTRSIPRWFWTVALVVLIGIGTARIVSTYHVFNHTYDEGGHLGCGLEWLDRARYEYEPQHPPLARIMMALGPYLDGSHSYGTPVEWFEETDKILYAKNYWRTLSLARAGLLPFFILTCVMVWFWGKRLFGEPAALVAVLLVSNIPPLLGHAGLANLDVATAGMLLAALYAVTRYLETPTLRNAAIFAVAIAAAVATKFTVVAFFPVALAGFLLFRTAWNWRFHVRSPRPAWRHAALFTVIFSVTIWSVYRFASNPVVLPAKDFGVAAKSQKLTRLPQPVLKILETPMPGGQLVRGFGSMFLHNERGHPSYLFGEFREKGWWYFFEVVLAVKTPIAFLLLSGIGVVLLLRRCCVAGKTPYLLAPGVFAAAILVFSMAANVNLGVRHVLIVYPLFALAAAFAVVEGWRRGGALRYGAAGLVVWQLGASALAHPDYMAYFNFLAGDRPERILVESDLDWGQDLHRSALRLKELGAHDVAVSYFGTARLNELPSPRPLTSCQEQAEWALVSIRMLFEFHRREIPQEEALYSCLKAMPAERIGKSMLLYRLRAPAAAVSLPAAGRPY